jgi:RES domain-containing protein
MILAWRLIHKNRIDAAFSGEGARRNGGRWNSRGVRVVYAADSLALAALELMAHSVPYRALNNFVFFRVEISDKSIHVIDMKSLPKSWRYDPPPAAIKKIGDSWVKDGNSPVLQIPSAVIPVGFNFLINPDHPDCKKISFGKPINFFIDERIYVIKGGRTNA